MDTTFKMPLWGPYSKKYMGLSHIVESLSDIGARADFSVLPTLWNSSTPAPNVTFPSNYHLWECSTDYKYYSYRYELMWKDLVYADISFSEISDDAYLMRCEFNNNTDLAQNCVLNIFSSLEFPCCEYVVPKKPDYAVIKKANDYDRFEYADPRPWDRETPDGLFRGMFVDKNFYIGKGLGDRCVKNHVKHLNFKPFGAKKGDTVAYTLTCGKIHDPVIAVRYRTVGEGDAVFDVNGTEVVLPSSSELTFTYIPYKKDPSFVSKGGAGVELDFLCVVSSGDTVSTKTEKRGYVPKIKTEKVKNGFRVRNTYPYDGCSYSVLTHNRNTRFRILESGCLEDALVNRLSNGDPTFDNLRATFSNSFKRKQSDEGFFQNTVIKSIFIEPHSSHVEYAVISKGDFEPLSDTEYESIYLSAKSRAKGSGFNKDGEKYAFSTGILKATLLLNTVYPVYRHGVNIVHHAPGKRWDSFYTWDSGFIGMGLLEFSPDLCLYALDTYLCDETNKDFCFLFHGSLVPMQFFEYFELIKRTKDKHSLDYLYGKLKLYYEFLRGRTHGSTCAKFGNGLLTVYDYWYSCSGMDDYPTQNEMIRRNAEGYTCPCLPTSQIILAGKILKAAASYLGKTEDIAVYDEDIRTSVKALNDIAWDEESGYFGYTVYDKEKPYIMKTADGENSNKGFDGIYPFIAGAVSGERKKRIIDHIKNPEELWSDAGISAVDMTASYYIDDGYWIGNVWMAHQWFVWKAMLDNGDTDFAFEIAKRALDIWKSETDFSYYTYECFGIKTKRGGWFHNFGGLSSPICIWANAYYRPGTVSSGFDLWTDYQDAGSDSAEIKFKYFGDNEKYSVIVTLSDRNEYTVTLDGADIPYFEREKGSLEVTLDGSVKSGVLKITNRRENL